MRERFFKEKARITPRGTANAIRLFINPLILVRKRSTADLSNIPATLNELVLFMGIVNERIF